MTRRQQNKGQQARLARLRQEAHSAMLAVDRHTATEETVERLVHILQTYQTELEMQNEELRRSQLELSRSRDSYAKLYANAPVGFITVNDKGVIVQANQTLAAMLETDRALLLDRPLSSLVAAEDQDDLFLLCQAFRRGRRHDLRELRLKKKNGELLWTEIVCARPPSEGGGPAPCLFQAAITDVSARKRVEEKLLKSESRLRMVLDATSDGVWDRNLVTGEVLYGDNWAKILGYTRQEVSDSGLLWEDLLHPDDRDDALAAVESHFDGDTDLYRAEFRMRHKDGEWRWILARGKVIERDSTGRPTRFVGTHSDITSRKKAEEELRASEARFRLLTEMSPLGIFMTDAEGRCLYVNPSWCQMAGLTPEQAMGDGWVAALHPEDRPLIERQWKELTDTAGRWEREYRFQTPDGATRWLYVLARPLRNEDDRVLGFIGTAVDITERKKAMTDLQRSKDSLERQLEELTFKLAETDRAIRQVNGGPPPPDALKRLQSLLASQQRQLEETTIALNVLMQKTRHDRQELEENLLASIERLVTPCLEHLKESHLDEEQLSWVEVIETNLESLAAPQARFDYIMRFRLTPTEAQVANLIKNGKSSKEIARLLHLAPATVNIHRKRIRKKLGITNRKINLRTFLASLP